MDESLKKSENSKRNADHCFAVRAQSDITNSPVSLLSYITKEISIYSHLRSSNRQIFDYLIIGRQLFSWWSANGVID